MNNTKECQRLLLVWASLQEKVRYDTIKKYCEYLNLQYNLCIDEHPWWDIFLPLYLAGNIDFCGENSFKATEPIAIKGEEFCIYTNVLNQSEQFQTDYPYIFRSKTVPSYEFKKTYEFNAISILNHYPTVKDIVATYQSLPLNDFSNLKFDNYKIKYGIAQKENWNMNYYFIYPENRKIVSVPSWNTVPDAINIAYSYSRSIDGRGNGSYDISNNVLRLTSFRIAIMLFRILLIESLLGGYTPFQEKGEYVFPCISLPIAKEVNRILNQSIRYE